MRLFAGLGLVSQFSSPPKYGVFSYCDIVCVWKIEFNETRVSLRLSVSDFHTSAKFTGGSEHVFRSLATLPPVQIRRQSYSLWIILEK